MILSETILFAVPNKNGLDIGNMTITFFFLHLLAFFAGLKCDK